MFFEHCISLIQLPITLLNMPVFEFIKIHPWIQGWAIWIKQKKNALRSIKGRIIIFISFVSFYLASVPSIFKETPCTNLNSNDQCSNAFNNPWLLLAITIINILPHQVSPPPQHTGHLFEWLTPKPQGVPQIHWYWIGQYDFLLQR